MSPKKVSSRMCHMCALFEWFWVISSDFWVIFLILSYFSDFEWFFWDSISILSWHVFQKEFNRNTHNTVCPPYFKIYFYWFWTSGIHDWSVLSVHLCICVVLVFICPGHTGIGKRYTPQRHENEWKKGLKISTNLRSLGLQRTVDSDSLSLFSLCILYHVRSALCQLSYMAQKQPWKTVFCFMKVFEFTKHTNTRKSEKQIYVQGNRV